MSKKNITPEIVIDDTSQDSVILPLEEHTDFLPSVISQTTALVPVKTKDGDAFFHYLKEISKYKVLSYEQEQALTKALAETGDLEVAKKLVLHNLRLVVKIAMDYRSTYSNVMDLIQEGNIGLMKAVSKYDASKGAKLSYYASWWIKSYILKYILDNFRLVKVGTTNEQKKIFYNLMKEKEELERLGIKSDAKTISLRLGVSEKNVLEMEQRIGAGHAEMSLDHPLSDVDGTSKGTFADTLILEEDSIEEKISKSQELDILQDNLYEFMKTLNERDYEIFEKRLLAEVPASLQAIADEYGVTRERIRQIEERLIKKLKVYMSEFLR